MATRFDDHFSRHAASYRKYRPTYPGELFSYLAELSPNCDTAWDVATGNGQAAVGLARHFANVVASDASVGQLRNGELHPRVRYVVCRAESRCLASESVALVTIAQALHWVDTPTFYETVRRVTADGGILAAWCYTLPRVSAPVDASVDRLHAEILAEFWPPGRKHVDAGYATIPFPFDRLAAPDLTMASRWSLRRFTDYIATWSAARRFAAARGEEPIDLVLDDLTRAWGDADEERVVRWPLRILAGKV